MTLNLDKNKAVLVEAWKNVLDDRNPIDWALFGYDGQTYDLNLVSKGDGGLEELADEFNSGKIQYALCKVKVKEKNNVQKVILINWQGEGAPLVRKGMSANHIDTIRSFFKGVHVSVQARTDEDVDPAAVLGMVAKAVAGEGLTVNSALVEEEPSGPIGSTYKRVNVQEEINSKAKDAFWQKDQVEEERRRREEMKATRKFSQDEVKLLRKESQDYFDQEEKQERNPSSGSNSNTSKGPETRSRQQVLDESGKKAPASNLIRQRIQSFDGSGSPVFPSNGVSSKSSSPVTKSPSASSFAAATIKTNGQAQPVTTNGKKEPSPGPSLSVLKRREMFEGGGGGSGGGAGTGKINPAEEIRQLQAQQEKEMAKAKASAPVKTVKAAPPSQVETVKASPPMEKPKSQQVPDVVAETFQAPKPQQHEQKPAFFNNPALSKSPEPEPEPEPVVVKSPSPAPAPISFNAKKAAEPEPEPEVVQDHTVHSAQNFNGNGKKEEGPSPVSASPDMITINITPEMGVCARALYDYQAADETEITFDPGDIIQNIEKIDEGWWEGLAPNNQYGLFPANYVELLN